MDSDKLQFGVEIEFAAPKDIVMALSDTDQSAVGIVATKLAELTNLPISGFCTCIEDQKTCDTCQDLLENRRFGGFASFSEPLPIDNDTDNAVYQYYHVQFEGCSHRGEVGLEISTPVRSTAELEAGLPEIKRLLSALKTMGIEPSVNIGCGLHVHVGLHGPSEDFSLLLAKKTVTIVALLEEKLILKLISEARSGRSVAKPIYRNSLLTIDMGELLPSGDWPSVDYPITEEQGLHVPTDAWRNRPFHDDEGDHLDEFLKLVWTAPDLECLEHGLYDTNELRQGFSICTRQNEDATTKGSFEFRYPSSELDIEHIALWTELCTQIVDIARLDQDQYAAKLRQIFRALDSSKSIRPRVIVRELLSILGLEHRVNAWKAKME